MTIENLYREKIELRQFLEKLLEVQSHADLRCYFVGGCVRDHLLGQISYDYDLAVDGILQLIIQALQEDYKLELSILGTAKVRFGNYHVDLATFRSEVYVMGNGLPEISAGDFEADLNRRDFTINTGYVLLSRENLDKMLQVDVAHEIELAFAHTRFREDIQNGVLRVLHENSFLEDPSRLLRAVKYSTLYPLKMDDATQTLFDIAIQKKALETYSKDRYRQIVFGYARHAQGVSILSSLYEKGLLLRLDSTDTSNITRIRAYLDAFKDALTHDYSGILFLLLMYEYQLDFWIGADRRISDIAKSFRIFLDIVATSNPSQWQSRWWCYEIFKRFDQKVLIFASYAKSVPERVKSALKLYTLETQFIKLNINGDTLKTLGVENGKIMGELLNLLLAHKVDTGTVMTHEEEIKWIESKRYEY